MHIGLKEELYFQMMNDVIMLEMNIVQLNNFDVSMYVASETGFSSYYTHLLYSCI